MPVVCLGGANKFSQKVWGVGPTCLAARYNQLEAVEELLAPADPSFVAPSIPLHIASSIGRMDVLKALLQYESSLEARDVCGSTALRDISTIATSSVVGSAGGRR